MSDFAWGALFIIGGISLIAYLIFVTAKERNESPDLVDFGKEKAKYYEYMSKLDYRPWQIDEYVLNYKTASELRTANKKLEKAVKKLEA